MKFWLGVFILMWGMLWVLSHHLLSRHAEVYIYIMMAVGFSCGFLGSRSLFALYPKGRYFIAVPAGLLLAFLGPILWLFNPITTRPTSIDVDERYLVFLGYSLFCVAIIVGAVLIKKSRSSMNRQKHIGWVPCLVDAGPCRNLA
jgi:hypothetical protein